MPKIFNIFSKLKKYERFLIKEEKSEKTVHKYIADVKRFKKSCEENNKSLFITKEVILRYKNYIFDNISHKAVNSNLSSLISYFKFIDRYDLIVKREKVSKRLFLNYEKMLTKNEINRLIETAIKNGKIRLALIITFIVNTGVRVSELKYITIENLKDGIAL